MRKINSLQIELNGTTYDVDVFTDGFKLSVEVYECFLKVNDLSINKAILTHVNASR
jgi:hypothetical protein